MFRPLEDWITRYGGTITREEDVSRVPLQVIEIKSPLEEIENIITPSRKGAIMYNDDTCDLSTYFTLMVHGFIIPPGEDPLDPNLQPTIMYNFQGYEYVILFKRTTTTTTTTSSSYVPLNSTLFMCLPYNAEPNMYLVYPNLPFNMEFQNLELQEWHVKKLTMECDPIVNIQHSDSEVVHALKTELMNQISNPECFQNGSDECLLWTGQFNNDIAVFKSNTSITLNYDRISAHKLIRCYNVYMGDQGRSMNFQSIFEADKCRYKIGDGCKAGCVNAKHFIPLKREMKVITNNVSTSTEGGGGGGGSGVSTSKKGSMTQKKGRYLEQEYINQGWLTSMERESRKWEKLLHYISNGDLFSDIEDLLKSVPILKDLSPSDIDAIVRVLFKSEEQEQEHQEEEGHSHKQGGCTTHPLHKGTVSKFYSSDHFIRHKGIKIHPVQFLVALFYPKFQKRIKQTEPTLEYDFYSSSPNVMKYIQQWGKDKCEEHYRVRNEILKYVESDKTYQDHAKLEGKMVSSYYSCPPAEELFSLKCNLHGTEFCINPFHRSSVNLKIENYSVNRK
jgi:hypothetical protein